MSRRYCKLTFISFWRFFTYRIIFLFLGGPNKFLRSSAYNTSRLFEQIGMGLSEKKLINYYCNSYLSSDGVILTTAFILFGSTEILSSEMTYPRNFMFLLQNRHFSVFSIRWEALIFSNTAIKFSSCSLLLFHPKQKALDLCNIPRF